jgi:outer membrane cobalamin receptor
VELGIARGKDEFKYGISMFANSIFDRIERKNTASSYINIMESGINGIETYFRAQPLENLSIFAGYAYTVAKEVYPQFTGRNDNELEYVPGNKWDFILNYMPVPGLKVNLLGMVNGRMYAYDENGAQLTINAYTLWNARVSYNVIENTTLSVSLNNILNSNYAEEPGYPQEGRSIIGTIDLLY